MTTLIYALSFIPMMLVTLAIHELGHLAIAKLNPAKTGGFHIGMGWNIITRHTGRTAVRLTPETELLNPQTEELKPGDLASVYVTKEPGDEGYTAAGLLPQNGTKLPPEQWNAVRRCNKTHMRLNGKVREIDEERIILADMSWSLRAIPIMAHVMLPDDPARKLPEAYNVMPWPRKAAITLAGPAANIVLMVFTLAIVAIFPITSVNTPAWTVAKVEPGGPAHEAGIRPGDRIVTINNLLYPSVQEINEQKEKAARTGKELRIGIVRNGGNLSLRVKPDPETGWIGIQLERLEVSRIEYRMTPQAAGQRMWNLGGSYLDAVTELLLTLTGDSENRLDAVQGTEGCDEQSLPVVPAPTHVGRLRPGVDCPQMVARRVYDPHAAGPAAVDVAFDVHLHSVGAIRGDGDGRDKLAEHPVAGQVQHPVWVHVERPDPSAAIIGDVEDAFVRRENQAVWKGKVRHQ